MDSNNEKGLFRRGEAYFGINEPERARDDFTKVVQLYPGNKAARAPIGQCQVRIRQQQERERKIYANMFQRLAEKEGKEEAAPVSQEKVVHTDVEMNEATTSSENAVQKEAEGMTTEA